MPRSCKSAELKRLKLEQQQKEKEAMEMHNATRASEESAIDKSAELKRLKLEQQQQEREAREMHNATRTDESELDKQIRKINMDYQQKAIDKYCME